MAKVRILKAFRDKDRFSVVYPVGGTFEFETQRARALEARGLVEVLGRKKRETAEVKESEAENQTDAETAEVKESEAENQTDAETAEVKESE